MGCCWPRPTPPPLDNDVVDDSPKGKGKGNDKGKGEGKGRFKPRAYLSNAELLELRRHRY